MELLIANYCRRVWIIPEKRIRFRSCRKQMSPDIAVPDEAARIRNRWRLSGSMRLEMMMMLMLMIRSG